MQLFFIWNFVFLEDAFGSHMVDEKVSSSHNIYKVIIC